VEGVKAGQTANAASSRTEALFVTPASPPSADIFYVECPGVYPSDYKKTVYRKVRRPLRPLDDITWEDVERHQTFA
jgi:microcystin degradation protein MlrC